MRKTWKKILATCCAILMLVTLPGMYILADELKEDIFIDEICEAADVPDDITDIGQAEAPNVSDSLPNTSDQLDDSIQFPDQDKVDDNVDISKYYESDEHFSDYAEEFVGAVSRPASTPQITYAGQIVDSITYRGVTTNAVYTPYRSGLDTDWTYGCFVLVKKFYSNVYGINVDNLVSTSAIPHASSGYFYETRSPRVGDIVRYNSKTHWALVKSISGSTVTLIQMNAYWTNYTCAQVGCTVDASDTSVSFFTYSGYLPDNTSPISPTPVEYKAPDIKNAHITNATTASYEVRFNAYDDSGIVFAQVGCWSDKWDIDKAKWYTVPFSNNYGAITIPVSDMGGYKDCWYYCNIYVVDEFGNKSEATTVKVFIDGTAPQIKNAHTTNTTTTSYEVRFNAYDDSDITFAQVGCWSDKWDIDKAKWYTVPFSNNYGAITIPISDMGGYKDCWYYCNIYTLDAFGNRSNATTVKVYICDTNSTNHNWGDPIWKWTGNDANGYSVATATVTCKTDKSHKMTFKATVTKKASGTGKNAKMTYTATATISGKKFTTTKTVAIKMALVSSASVGKLKTIKLTPVLTPKDTPVEAYTWKSSKPAAAKVNSSGTVTGANLGQTDITATCSKYGLSAKCTVNVWFNDVMPKDVPAGITKENYQYIYWGVKNGIINGYADGSFKPNNPVTRAQFCIMIWKLAGKPAPSSKAASFKDISGLTANGQKAIKWAQEKGLVNGFGNGIFKPNDVLTRCQIMIILWKWSGRPAYGNMAKYSDISALTLNTQKAISWGVNNRIISASGNKFTPNGNVSRADFLNILYQFNKVSYKKIPSNLDAVPKQ